ncbi:hypothetical protein [Ancylobacter oerskovii]|uniref:Uncharacterized protein n=1 Tax=Ancylobacter oerskovii TaxID=459519 RepID=A0ABW4YWF8_9HYPH|nr:hypothetical protein [Ancylobacter oerskovii]MBS7542399.1 hypothetical protein [Ancylobacter oerskovii]
MMVLSLPAGPGAVPAAGSAAIGTVYRGFAVARNVAPTGISAALVWNPQGFIPYHRGTGRP